jgi:hypothetical protein
MLVLRRSKPEPEAAIMHRGIVGNRIAAMLAGNYMTVAKCDIRLGMDNTKAWKKAGDRFAKCVGKEAETASCYLKAGRSDLLIKKRKHAERKGNFEAMAIYDIAHGSDPARAWKAAGDAYLAKGWNGTAARCYRKGGLEAEAMLVEARASQADTVNGLDPQPYDDVGDNWKFIMNPHR